MYFSEKDYYLGTVYLFSLLTGVKTSAKERKYRELGKSLYLSERNIDEVLNFCNNIPLKKGEDNSNEIIRKFIKMYYETSEGFNGIESIINRFSVSSAEEIMQELKDKYRLKRISNLSYMDKSFKAKIMWDAAQNGFNNSRSLYADKRVLYFLGITFELDKLVITELIDTLETIYEINVQKKRIKSSNKPEEVIISRTKELNKNIAMLRKNIEITIKELDIY